jgi:hypothetical protein
MNDTPATDEEQEAAFRRSLAFNTEAARAGLFAAALDIAETMKEAQVPHGESCIMTGAVEMAVQLWAQVSETAGVPRKKSRETLEKEMRRFFAKHWGRANDPPATEQ